MSSEDRRVRKTKQALRSALDELLLERQYGRISVQDILDRSDVGKTTFYAHYGNKDDLLRSNCFTTQTRRAFFDDDGELRDFPDLELLLDHFLQRRAAYLAVPGSPAWEVVRSAAQRDLREHWFHWASGNDGLAVNAEVTAQFLAGGVLALIETWPTGSKQSLTSVVRSMMA